MVKIEYESNLIVVEKFPNKVAKLTLNNPPLNIMLLASMQELKDTLKKIRKDDEVRCIVICGNKKAFCVGSNLKEVLGNKDDVIGKKLLRENETLNMLEGFEKFTIAAIEGYAYGGGMELAISCDMRVMSKNAKAGFPEINSGLRPGGGGCYRLPKLIGTGKALELMLLGEILDAETCEKIGLVNRITEPGKALDVAMEIAETVARKSQQSVRLIRASIRDYGFKTSEEAFWPNLHHCEELYEQDDWYEGVTAFIEKRKPNFFNRK
jgi:enoyl-CoA hydratase/carnithine racemase